MKPSRGCGDDMRSFAALRCCEQHGSHSATFSVHRLAPAGHLGPGAARMLLRQCAHAIQSGAHTSTLRGPAKESLWQPERLEQRAELMGACTCNTCLQTRSQEILDARRTRRPLTDPAATADIPVALIGSPTPCSGRSMQYDAPSQTIQLG